MTYGPEDPRWPKLLSLSVHEFRTPMTVVAGYIRMLLKDRAGPVTEQQRRLLEEAEKSCARLSTLLAEMSDLGGLEGGTATVNLNGQVDVRAVLAEAIAGLPEVPDREIPVRLEEASEPLPVKGDAVRLKNAFASILSGLRREIISAAPLCVQPLRRSHEGRPAAWIAIGEPEQIAGLSQAEPDALTTFDEWRGGVGLSLPVARRVINRHGGAVYSMAGGAKATAAIALPLA